MSSELNAYQVMPPLDDEQYKALRESIAEHGVQVPVDVDEAGRILDGHNRKAIAAELGMPCPSRVVAGLADDEARMAYALEVNVHRRHLTREQRRELAGKLREQGWTIRKIARQRDVSVGTAAADVRPASPRPQQRRVRAARKAAGSELNAPVSASAEQPANDAAPHDEAGVIRIDAGVWQAATDYYTRLGGNLNEKVEAGLRTMLRKEGAS